MAAANLAPGQRRPDAREAWATAFVGLTATALVLHVLWWDGVTRAPLPLLAVGTAAWLLARPRSGGRLALFCVATAAAVLAQAPRVESHLALLLLIAGGLLALLVLDRVRAGVRAGAPVAPATSAPRRLVPLLRAAVVVLYVAAAAAKANPTYLDPATSPALDLTARALGTTAPAIAATWWAPVPVRGALAVELALPVLLLLPRTRTAGLVLGLAFHALLAASGTVPYTALMLALYLAFVPPAAVDRAARTAGAVLGVAAMRGGRWADAAAMAAVLLWVAVGVVLHPAPGRVDGEALGLLLRAATGLAALATAAAIAWDAARRPAVRSAHRGPRAVSGSGSRREPGRTPAAGAVGTRGVLLAGLAALVLYAGSPYLGVRAGDAFTMYSGLDTSPSGWNSAVVPASVRVLGAASARSAQSRPRRISSSSP